MCVTSSRDFLPRASLRPCHTEVLEVFMQLQHCWRPPAPSNPAPPHPHPQQGGHTSSSDTTAEDARDFRTPVTQRRSCGCRAQRCLFFFNLRRRCSTCMSVSRRRSLHAKGPVCSIYKRPVGCAIEKKKNQFVCLFFLTQIRSLIITNNRFCVYSPLISICIDTLCKRLSRD